MFSPAECLAKAAELTEQAEACPSEEIRRDIIDTAKAWCELATFAAWQDRTPPFH